MSIESIVDAVVSSGQIRIRGLGTHAHFLGYPDAPNLDMSGFQGIVEHDVDDQVVVVRAGTSVAELNAELAETGQIVPYLSPLPVGSVGGSIAMNLPHLREGQCGSWRDWVLGMTIIRGDGTVAKCGSKAVKNVAGYDVQKLFIGSRGSLAVIVEAVLRTYPLKALDHVAPMTPHSGPVRIQRVLRTDFENAHHENGDLLIVSDFETGTLWTRQPMPKRFANDWLIDSENSLVSAHPHLVERMSQVLDPDRRFAGRP